MEKCNCKYCEAREFFTGFDKNGKYTGEAETRNQLSVYDQLQEAITKFENRGCINSLLAAVKNAMDKIDDIDSELGHMEDAHEDIEKLRGELY